MIKPKPKPTDRKRLDCEPAVLFAEVAMLLSVPMWEELQRWHGVKGPMNYVGPYAWLLTTQDGLTFTQCVRRHGEAAARAYYWLAQYCERRGDKRYEGNFPPQGTEPQG